MSEIKETRLRYITASSKDELMSAVAALGFRIEIKEIIKDGSKYTVFFVLPEQANIKFNSVDLTS